MLQVAMAAFGNYRNALRMRTHSERLLAPTCVWLLYLHYCLIRVDPGPEGAPLQAVGGSSAAMAEQGKEDPLPSIFTGQGGGNSLSSLAVA